MVYYSGDMKIKSAKIKINEILAFSRKFAPVTIFHSTISFSVFLQMFLADDYEEQGLCKGHCPFCRRAIDTLQS